MERQILAVLMWTCIAAIAWSAISIIGVPQKSCEPATASQVVRALFFVFVPVWLAYRYGQETMTAAPKDRP